MRGRNSAHLFSSSHKMDLLTLHVRIQISLLLQKGPETKTVQCEQTAKMRSTHCQVVEQLLVVGQLPVVQRLPAVGQLQEVEQLQAVEQLRAVEQLQVAEKHLVEEGLQVVPLHREEELLQEGRLPETNIKN